MLSKKIKKLEDKIARLEKMICDFCREEDWGAEVWKDQWFIKPLFEEYARIQESKK